jgi:murein DD-endopeptidase MepM/ murein hydrolase activator NlpD
LSDLFAKARRHLDVWLPAKHQTTLFTLTMALVVLVLVQGMIKPDKDDLLSKGRASTANRQAILLEQLARLDNRPIAFHFSGPQQDPGEIPERLFLTVNPGENLSLVFKRAGLGPAQVHEVANSSTDASVLARLFPGDQLAFELDEEEGLRSLELIKSPRESFLFSRKDSSAFHFDRILRQPHVEIAFKDAVINDSLFMAAQKGGIPASMAMDLAGIFGGVVDFMLDTRTGDTFSVIYEEEYLDGKHIGNGRILGASFTNQGVRHVAVRYTNASGESNFYNLEGESMRKAFLQNPVDFTRISSNFSLSRRHPILNTIRAHRGTDYAAPTGTPVVSTADGRVTFASRNGSFGKLVVIQHGDRFQTKYAHLNDYAKGIKVGSRVQQGDVIGYVGSTGSATGPHLHYEFLMDGVHRNWRTIQNQLPKSDAVPKEELATFREQTALLLSMLETRGASMQVAQSKAPRTRNE